MFFFYLLQLDTTRISPVGILRDIFACMDTSLKNVCNVSLGITYTAYYILGRKQTASLR